MKFLNPLDYFIIWCYNCSVLFGKNELLFSNTLGGALIVFPQFDQPIDFCLTKNSTKLKLTRKVRKPQGFFH